MSKILKIASAVAIAASTLAALSATDATMAFDGQQKPSAQITAQQIEFIAGEIVQPLPVASAITPTPEVQKTTDSAADTSLKADSLTELVAATAMPSDLSAEMKCLAGAIYFESKGETLNGQLAVAKVVIARSHSGRFPSSYCGVVYQRSQFSFVRGGSMPGINTNSRGWSEAVRIAAIADSDSWDSPVEGALFFHARTVSPKWRLTRMAQIDNHVFYR